MLNNIFLENIILKILIKLHLQHLHRREKVWIIFTLKIQNH